MPDERKYFIHQARTEKSFLNLIKSIRSQIVFTIFRLIRNQLDVRLVPNQSLSVKYNLISFWFNNISKIFLCVHLNKTGKSVSLLGVIWSEKYTYHTREMCSTFGVRFKFLTVTFFKIDTLFRFFKQNENFFCLNRIHGQYARSISLKIW